MGPQNVTPIQMLRAAQVTIRRVMNQWWRRTEGEWVAVMCRSISLLLYRMLKKSASTKKVEAQAKVEIKRV
jgi:hypothetical protein